MNDDLTKMTDKELLLDYNRAIVKWADDRSLRSELLRRLALVDKLQADNDQWKKDYETAKTLCRFKQSEVLRLAEDVDKARDERDEARAEVERLGKKSDEEMLRVKACEHIAEGERGWESLENVCPSTMAVAKLKKDRDETERYFANSKRAVETLKRERDEAQAACAKMRLALEPFKSGTWGKVKAYICEGAPDREVGIQLAKNLTHLNFQADEALLPTCGQSLLRELEELRVENERLKAAQSPEPTRTNL